jgi:2-succinyl-5-enolpyruvyl-6-hydroxy-3-cyclohexene-1-carboxylate synthase
LSRSVPSASEAQATFAATLFDHWAQLGLTDVVISPGSRSTPLALAASASPGLTIHVRLDERSAGFFALGRALATGRPVVVVVTSGTAATELHACVAEADLAFVPLIIVTADRPPELHGVGAPQTIEQGHLYGNMVRRFEDAFVVDFHGSNTWRGLADELWIASDGVQPGPVHLNVAFVEPLLADALELPPRIATFRHDDVPAVSAPLDLRGLAVLCVVGRGVSREMIAECRERNWVVLGDATANGTLPYFDSLLRSSAFIRRVKPDVVVRLGGLPASKVLGEQLRAWGSRTVAFAGAGFVADPDRLIGESFDGLPARDDATLLGAENYVVTWTNAARDVGRWLELRDGDPDLNEPGLARVVVAVSNESGAALVVGSSMPVRDVEWWAPARESATFANRGANGIDGVVSTVLGIAVGSKAIGLVGDLTMLHDVSGLVDGLGSAGGTCVLVVADNRGGGIFSFLPQASRVEPERFEQLFGTPRLHDLTNVAQAFGHVATSVETLDELREAIDKGLAGEGLSVVVAKVPSRADNVRLHETWNDEVARLMERT